MDKRASRTYAKQNRSWLVVLLLVSFTALAALVTINTSGSAYRNLSNVVGTSIRTDAPVRVAGGTQVAAVYRNLNGGLFGGALKVGHRFKIVWPDGSSEEVEVVSLTSHVGAVPVPGTQAPGSGGGSGGSGGTGGAGGGSGGGGAIGSGCVAGCNPKVDVGEPVPE